MRRGSIFAILWTTVSVISAPASTRAVEEQGNIFVIGEDGTRIQITTGGTDLQPDLRFDGATVVFVRKINQTEALYLADVHAPPNPRSLLSLPVTIDGREIDTIFAPKFSPDGASVYFLVRLTEATNAIVSVSVKKPAPRIVASALDFQVVSKGRYRGDLIANVRKAKLGYGYYDCFWLLSPEGKEIGVVGPDPRDVALFLELQE